MNHDTNVSALPALVGNILTDKTQFIDNIFATIWNRLNCSRAINLAGFTKRSGIKIGETVFVLLIWKWLNMSSIALFSRQALSTFSGAKKDVLYDLLKRENIDWRKFNLHIAKSASDDKKIQSSKMKAFVLDDSIKARKGKKIEGVSSHFDHVTNRHVMGHQVLTLGLATDDAFMPIDSQIYISAVKAKALNRPFSNENSIVAKRYEEAKNLNKLQMAAEMMKRAIASGIKADCLVADAWFGTKNMINTAMSLNVQAILRMKKSKLKYRVSTGGSKKTCLDAKEIYSLLVKSNWRKVNGLPWKSIAIDAEINLTENTQEPPRWKSIVLVFVKGLKDAADDSSGSTSGWSLFLATDKSMSTVKILEMYALRWSIEVYFKEAKQHLGFLVEQTTSFASHTASIHLCAIRYLMLVYAKINENFDKVCSARASIQEQLESLNYAGKLWLRFKTVIADALSAQPGLQEDSIEAIKLSIDAMVAQRISNSLNWDSELSSAEASFGQCRQI